MIRTGMKLTVICTAILTFISAWTPAEAQKHPQFRYLSFDAGFNAAGIRSATGYDDHAKNFGIRSGISCNYSFNDSRSAGAAVVFDQKGAVDPVFGINTNLSYLTLPVFIKLISGKEPRMFLTAGAYVSTLMNATRRGERFIEGKSTRINEKVTDNFNRHDFGLTAGGGLMFRLYDDFDFMISAGYSAGLLSVEDIPGYNPKNHHLNISAGYIYYIGLR
jgi:hypothetical protein